MDIEKLMYDRVAHRRETYKSFLVGGFKPLSEETEPFIMGTYSRTFLSARERSILHPKTLMIGDLEESPTTLARDYITSKFGKGRRMTGAAAEAMRGARVPVLAVPCRFDYGYYVDIEAAWWNIQLAAGWNADYNLGHWWSLGEQPLDFPYPDSKIARSALVTLGEARGLRVFYPQRQEVRIQDKWNHLTNHHLFYSICHVLTCIAFEIITRAGACAYINNDGYIICGTRQKDIACDIINSWGLTPRIKLEGPGWVSSVGGYRVGPHRSARDSKMLTGAMGIQLDVAKNCFGWVKERFVKMARRPK